MREVRLALLEADVNFKVARALVDRIRERAVGADVLESLTPGQQIVKIVNEELVALLGGEQRKLRYQSAAAHRGDADRPPGERQDHHLRQARPGDPPRRAPPAAGRRRHPASRRAPAAREAGQGQPDPGRHAGREEQAPRALQARSGRGPAAQLRRRHPRHRRPPPDRPADARGAEGDPQAHPHPRHRAGGRRHDRAGGGQRRPRIRPAGGGGRHHPDQAGRGCPRRRGPLHEGVDGQADPLHRGGGEGVRAGAVPARADGLAHPRHGRHPHPGGARPVAGGPAHRRRRPRTSCSPGASP